MWCFWHLFSCRNDFSRRFYFRNLSRTSSATNSLFTRALICYGFRFCHILVYAIFTPSRKTPKIRRFPRYPLYHTQRITLWVLCWVWCLGAESNHRQADFQSAALPTELPRQVWRPKTGSNRRPPAWQAGALTNWAIGPFRRSPFEQCLYIIPYFAIFVKQIFALFHNFFRFF